ncbi:YqeG family HAD IIIA-type phosphatase [Roseofilum capinflatum]|uniref:YqeG family HAD IIIA-type phosphatase n=1 Tax=Roseofilum capinflatum BLCC-M114 TaxID=3022440 RepID=A0ABT7BC64_9CYAN|nr:YqeG family HAD IIIA-type phosphatase [Roseofilum capinflatum]MDJ1176774.1 YqeG family HAD IIIA-type phosphatase [Roseofilum capinflatum BLCC-M114]
MSSNLLLQPDLVLGGPILELTPDLLRLHGLKGLILDVDDTLVPMNTQLASDELQTWIAEIRPLVSIWLVSNNLNWLRIRAIAECLDLPFMMGAAKPSRRKLRQAVDKMGLPLDQVAMVGDRLFTDVLAGNRLGMFTILVEPMVDPRQNRQPFHVRSFEVWFSQVLGARLTPSVQKFTNFDKT